MIDFNPISIILPNKSELLVSVNKFWNSSKKSFVTFVCLFAMADIFKLMTLIRHFFSRGFLILQKQSYTTSPGGHLLIINIKYIWFKVNIKFLCRVLTTWIKQFY